jgi:NADH dehydrogenase FAD-containing subunit
MTGVGPRPRAGGVRVVVLGGGFGGVTTARHLERLCAGRPDVEITLVSRDNFFVLSPLLFETIEAEAIVLVADIVPNAVAAGLPVARDARGRITVDATMRSVSHPELWALGDCAAIPGPDGHPYPALAQHAIREARQLARNLGAVLDGRQPTPFVSRSLGTMAALGHFQAVAEIMGVRLTGFLAWWLRRTYHLLQMPRWERRLRIVIDWTVALFFRPDITKVDLAAEWDQTRRNGPAGATRPRDERTTPSGTVHGSDTRMVVG